MHITWIGGWAVSPTIINSLAELHYPDHAHTVIYPGEKFISYVPRETNILIGYSLGAFLMLLNRDKLPIDAKKILISPFIDYKKEAEMGGKISLTQLKYLVRMLKQNSIPAINQFYKEAGLLYSCDSKLPYRLEDLIWGIKQLIDYAVKSPIGNQFHAYLGEKDLLLDHTIIAKFFSDISIIPNSSHKLEDMISNINISAT